ncbi:MAG: hypothetical protein COA78_20340 [Blastopirellula sp.]|nr:MAG: hypothetical protein COA78_20340 [Blastopirellula sp.]
MDAPIPGQSLTSAPGTYPYERPPEISDPEEAIQMHLTRLNTSEMIEDILDTLELGITVKELTEGIARSAVAEGLHSIDVSMIISPVIHEYIKSTADEAGIEYDEGLIDEEEQEARTNAIVAAKAEAMMGKEVEEEMPMAPPVEPVAEEPRGLMTRRV